MLRRRVGQDAVAEIEHEGRVPQQVENFAHPPLKMRSAGEQEERIEIALHRQAALQVLPDEGERHAGIAADGVDAGPLRVAPRPRGRIRAEIR